MKYIWLSLSLPFHQKANKLVVGPIKSSCTNPSQVSRPTWGTARCQFLPQHFTVSTLGGILATPRQAARVGAAIWDRVLGDAALSQGRRPVSGGGGCHRTRGLGCLRWRRSGGVWVGEGQRAVRFHLQIASIHIKVLVRLYRVSSFILGRQYAVPPPPPRLQFIQ